MALKKTGKTKGLRSGQGARRGQRRSASAKTARPGGAKASKSLQGFKVAPHPIKTWMEFERLSPAERHAARQRRAEEYEQSAHRHVAAILDSE